MELLEIKSAIESLLFAWGESLSLRKISNILEVTLEEATEAMLLIKEEYTEENKGIFLVEVNNSYQFATAKHNYEYVQRLCNYSHSKGLTKVSAEVLAIIAYKQPITKYEIDQIRGVKSDKPLQQLIDRELIGIKGRLEKIGRPIVYGTTEMFLKAFGFKTLKDMPDIETFIGSEIFVNGSFEEEEDHETT
ncbi:MAG: SMC-Scp complex subunit ScpB [Clostridia bacterium]|nr:SMC-Scp complex subunit ScpB [Clostridia bacterium]